MMLQMLFVLNLLALGENGVSIFAPPANERILVRSRRVVGGDPTTINRMPYLVNIRRDGSFECGGTLITPTCVLSAAHCIKTGAAEDFVIRGGVTYLTDWRNSRRVQQIFRPVEFDNKTLDYDVAIFKLQKPLTETTTETITLASAKDKLNTGDRIRVSGWGLTSETAILPSNQLRTVELSVMSLRECQNLYRNYRNVTTAMFCASVPGVKDACSADSGGPAIANGKLVGIVSWGKGYECGRASSPGVYVNVAAMRPWIDNIVQRACL